ncbi:MAG: methylated-DNA--[protein]-cysteine S-methyltransferase [Deltaproteobacteria bacterium]|nr:methylated-DNA--[protein]-cysteine S-methyltransferase [Deltaproteobacteria bacterium]
MNRKIIKSTPFGSVNIIWSTPLGSPKILRVILSKPDHPAENQTRRFYPNSRVASCSEIDRIASSIKAFLEGENIVIPLDVANLDLCSSFQQSVLRAECGIPRGYVSTYQLLAKYLGKRNGARAVGNALANNPFPIIVPCHRAIRSDLHLGGYQGGLEMKRALLAKEGIGFDAAGRVTCSGLYYGKTVKPCGVKSPRFTDRA